MKYLKSIKLKIADMHCAMCAKTIENTLKKLDGIVEANVNLGEETVFILYNTQLTTLYDIKKSIESAGYKYLGLEEEEKKELTKEKELKNKLIKIIAGFIIGISLLILSYVPVKLPFSLTYFMFVVATPTFIYLSYPIFKAGWSAFRNKNLNMDVMYSLGMGVAFVSSVLGTFNILSKEFLFYDTSILLATFLSLGRYLEARAKEKTGEAIKLLIGLQPKTAKIFRNNKEIEIPIEEVMINDLVIVKPGEKIPVDGEVVDGESFVDESMITGEAIPIIKNKGDRIIGGTINKNSIIKFRATKVGKDTMLSQIIKLVEETESSKTRIQRIADKVVGYFIPVVLGLAVISFILWYFILGNTIVFALNSLISVLVIACPCALGLATPTAITVGVGRGAELGILIKNSEALEIAEKLTTIVFDKTATLTTGKPEVTDLIKMRISEEELLKLTASVEKNSSHPLADAIVKKAKEKNIKLEEVKEFNTFGGKGVIAKINNKEIVIGNKAFFNEKGIIYTEEVKEKILNLETVGKTVILVAIEKEICGIIAIADTLKKDTKRAIDGFKKMKLNLIMLTGDNRKTANAIAKEIGIEKVVAEVLPQDKAWEIKKLKKEGQVVAFIGDGINDAPALAEADIGIALGSGTDIAIESGDMVLIKDELIEALKALQLSKKVMSRIKQNLFWAFAYNTALIPVAAGILYPFFNITLRPEWAGLAMAMSSVTVVTLSLMLKRYTPSVSSNF